MPGVQYSGWAAKFKNPRFARTMLAMNLCWMLMVSFWFIVHPHSDLGPKIDVCKEVEIEWAEFLEHTCENENLWILIRGQVYNMWPWGVKQHPGGRMICQAAGKDATEIFDVIHPEYVLDMLQDFCIGRIVNVPADSL